MIKINRLFIIKSLIWCSWLARVFCTSCSKFVPQLTFPFPRKIFIAGFTRKRVLKYLIFPVQIENGSLLKTHRKCDVVSASVLFCHYLQRCVSMVYREGTMYEHYILIKIIDRKVTLKGGGENLTCQERGNHSETWVVGSCKQVKK